MTPTRCLVPGATDQSSDPTEATVVTRAPEAFQTTMPRPGVAAEASTTSSWPAWMAVASPEYVMSAVEAVVPLTKDSFSRRRATWRFARTRYAAYVVPAAGASRPARERSIVKRNAPRSSARFVTPTVPTTVRVAATPR